MHYRQPWVIGVQEEMVRLRKRVEEADEMIKCVPILSKQIESLEVCQDFFSVYIRNLIFLKLSFYKSVTSFLYHLCRHRLRGSHCCLISSPVTSITSQSRRLLWRRSVSTETEQVNFQTKLK